MTFVFNPTLVGGRVNLTMPDNEKVLQDSPLTKYSIQAYSVNSFWGKFKLFIGQAEIFSDNHGNKYILNIRSLGKVLQLFEGVNLDNINFRTKKAAFWRFFNKGVERNLNCLIDIYKGISYKKKYIDNPDYIKPLTTLKKVNTTFSEPAFYSLLRTVVKEKLKDQIAIKEEAISGGDVFKFKFYLRKSDNEVMLCQPGLKPCTNLAEMKDCYEIVGRGQCCDGVFNINLQKDSMVYITDASEFNNQLTKTKFLRVSPSLQEDKYELLKKILSQ